MTFEQFETMTDTQLSAVEGGVNVANEYGSSYWGYVSYCKDGIHVTPYPYVCREKRRK
ncbi:bacteriocin class II family protein [Streptococcus sp. H31]|uniref:bacteriocin class II family protein n=1 Tax=Streptococcus huangxiaojuni TaxID=3237239 RepID=UPI0034A56B3A